MCKQGGSDQTELLGASADTVYCVHYSGSPAISAFSSIDSAFRFARGAHENGIEVTGISADGQIVLITSAGLAELCALDDRQASGWLAVVAVAERPANYPVLSSHGDRTARDLRPRSIDA